MPASPEIQMAVSTIIFALRPGPQDLPSLWAPFVPRTREPHLNKWALPGGWLPPHEELEDAAARTLAETTGLHPSYLEQLYTFGKVDRSPTGRVISVVYWALVRADEALKAIPGENVQWFPADHLPELAFDHNNIVKYALERLRTKVEYSEIAHSFLGETFTIAQLRSVHEAVLGHKLDAANFRRSVATSPDLIDTGEVLAGTPHRPPKLFRFQR
ncbi:ADP-ribose pyrophosphatase [Corynebacterium glutamicum MB001]|uniref:ADP-ribose pyrophosphatase n=1 Tax=Corynebacterium glutamicum (strain ATCC 13032 / DSM 20300 / JCM 1318 / BCRC 11384 / CCUG 27702 / LMG 3730 / NBRC 12168 / NCIMB 10025 / NRRL B-2784 / 534) TaxID=196627 RepID=Q8NRH9_CORGL|nr:NUDIX domain-containing protein [Corynebacterium glutamicum]AGT05063.1 ADP-ribose pyrophosphatase [Corynebacterium glutamicum MB001]ARV64768.1 NUDIX hydrolase [Corynebacterium glutamicum]ASW13724.1 ADP-ribose pyrophosphatase [Corynebacterium glutamicum]AUI00611.1 NUDIX hydrolase [Corynebacterium glutamicum]AUI04255.1 NUDIX hydrolase [Corynebacterium glutamicum]